MSMRSVAFGVLGLCAPVSGLQPVGPVVQPGRASSAVVNDPALQQLGRRSALVTAASALATLGLAGTPEAAFASGGATAGKYTTIPIAKRRYFGRVKQGVFEFVLLEKALKDGGDLRQSQISEFFADNIKIQQQRQKTNCLVLGDGSKSCEVDEKFSSRWEDLQLSMYLLGNAFRMDSGKPPEKVKQVKEAKAFFKEVGLFQKASQKNDLKDARVHYALARDALDFYLNDVELPPSDDEEYSKSADLRIQSLCQGSFCI